MSSNSTYEYSFSVTAEAVAFALRSIGMVIPVGFTPTSVLVDGGSMVFTVNGLHSDSRCMESRPRPEGGVQFISQSINSFDALTAWNDTRRNIKTMAVEQYKESIDGVEVKP